MDTKNKKPLFLVVIIIIFIAAIITTFFVTKYILNDKDKNNNNDDIEDVNDDNNLDAIKKIDNNKDYIYSLEEYKITDLGDTDTIQDWMKDKSFYVKTPVINIDKSDIISINNHIAKTASDSIEAIKYSDIYNDGKRYLSYFITYDYDYYRNSNVLSLVLKLQEYLIPSSFVAPEYEIYNIDLNTGNILSNDNLLSLKGTDKIKFLSNVKSSLNSQNINACDNQIDPPENGCYQNLTVDNESRIFLDKNNKLNIVVGLQLFDGSTIKVIEVNN